MNILEIDAYQSEWLNGLDLAGKTVQVIINGVSLETVQNQRGERAQKAAVSFRSKGGQMLKKRLLLNKTNAIALAKLFGTETDAWVGKGVSLRPEMITAFGQQHNVVRIAGASPAASNGKPAEPPAATADDAAPHY